MTEELRWRRKDLLGIAELSAEEVRLILDTAESFREVAERPVKKVPTMRGKTVVNLFFEASTRTRSSFEIAEKRLSADGLSFSSSGSSLSKGESVDRHRPQPARRWPRTSSSFDTSHPGSAADARAGACDSGVINAGDGAHEHPTQALLDALHHPLAHKGGTLGGLKVSIIGDI